MLALHFFINQDGLQKICTSNSPSTIFYTMQNCLLDTFSPWWHHQMETFSALLALCEGNSLVTVEFTSQRPVMRSFYISLIGAHTIKTGCRGCHCDLEQHMSCLNCVFVYGSRQALIKSADRFYFVGGATILWQLADPFGDASIRWGASNRDITVFMA